MGKLAGRRALVTGAASGIGAATAARLRRDGAAVVTSDVAADVDVRGDVTDRRFCLSLVNGAAEQLGGLDILVPCAGITGVTPIEALTDDAWERMFDINLHAVFRMIRAATPHLKASGSGRVITIGSTLSRFGAAGMTAYGASKHAVLGLTRSAASELGPHGITVNCVQPGAIETPMTQPTFQAQPEFARYWTDKAALGRLGQPEDIADTIAFLASEDARFVSGQGFFVDGGAMQGQ